jgi:hypothetical protein
MFVFYWWGWNIEQCVWIIFILLVAKPDDSSGFDLTSSVDYAGFAVAIAVVDDASVADRVSASWSLGLFCSCC